MGVMTINTFGPWIYGQEWVVSKILGPEESISHAITSIIDASASKRYKISVMPGEYLEAVTMKAYVDLVCEYGRATIKPPLLSTFGVTMASNSMLQGFQVDLITIATTGVTGIVIGALTNVIVEDCWVTGGGATDLGVTDASAGTSVILRKLRVDSTTTGYQKTAAGSTWLADSRITSATDGIDIDVNLGTLDLHDNELMGLGTGANVDVAAAVITINSSGNFMAGDGWQIAASANIAVYTNNDDFSKVTFAGALGTFVDLTDCKLYTCGAGVAVGEWVYVSANDTATEAKADALTTMPCIGVAVSKPTATTCYVKQYGYYYDAVGAWVFGEEYWVSAVTAGAITTAIAPVWPQRVAIGVSAQKLKIVLGDNQGLVHCNEYLAATGTVVVNQWVYMTATNDLVGLADCDAAATMGAIGVCVQVTIGAPNDTLLVKMRGKNSVSDPAAAWVASDDIYISGTAGGIQRTIPMGIIQKVAEVKSYTSPTLVYEISD